MYKPITDDELEERYKGQMDDISDSQYAYEYGMTLYEIGKRYYIDGEDYAELIIYWLKRYVDQEETRPECVKKSRYIIAKLHRSYPKLRNCTACDEVLYN